MTTKQTKQTKAKRKKSPSSVFCVFTNDWTLFGTYASKEEAEMDIYGPVFRPRHRIVEYKRVRTTTYTRNS